MKRRYQVLADRAVCMRPGCLFDEKGPLAETLAAEHARDAGHEVHVLAGAKVIFTPAVPAPAHVRPAPGAPPPVHWQPAGQRKPVCLAVSARVSDDPGRVTCWRCAASVAFPQEQKAVTR